MKARLTIERIQNGFIVSNTDGSERRFYRSIADYWMSEVLPEIEKTDKYFREHATYGETMLMVFESEFTPENDTKPTEPGKAKG